MNRLGKADSGVSMWSLSLFVACGFVLTGGAGRAKGLGGPEAPAESKAFVDGDGGGRTTPCCGAGNGLMPGPVPVFILVSLGEVDSAVALPPSDCSLGI
ncbi:hypothetical protein M8818_000785 [Zalaria obscura]|uniref:Uncharacterized protein n=1 Tax=Zalaria obscura TaxID=2024903 RepID=A0ACC3SNF0_9PEZI